MSPKKISLSTLSTALCIWLMCFTIAIPQTVGPTSEDVSEQDAHAIRDIVSSFFAAYRSKKLESLKVLWSEKSPFFAGHMAQVDEIFRNSGEISITVAQFGPVRKKGEQAGVWAEVKFSGSLTIGGNSESLYGSHNRYLVLTKEGSVWKITRHISAERELALRLIDEKSADARERMLSSESPFVNKQLTLELTQEGNRKYGQVEWKDVLDIYQFNLLVAEKVKDQKEISLAYNSLGNVLKEMGEKAKARKAYERSIAISQSIGDRENIARVTYNLSDVVDNADEMLDQALVLAKESGNKEFIVNAIGKKGNRHNMRGEIIKAKELLEEALSLRRELGDPENVSIGLSNMGLVHQSLGNYEEAKAHFEESIKLSESVENYYAAMIDLYNLGNVFKEIGDYASAVIAYEKSLEAGRKNDPNDENAPVLINMAGLLSKQGNLDRAEQLYMRTATAFERTGSKYGYSRALGGLSSLFRQRGNFEKAIEFGLKAHAIYVSEKDGEIKESLRRLGELYAETGDFDRAEARLKEALDLSQISSSPAEQYLSHISFAKLNIWRGNYKEARNSLDRARGVFPGFTLRADAWEYFDLMGQVSAKLGDEKGAERSYDQAITAIEKQRTRVAGGSFDDQKYFAAKLAPFRAMVNVQMRLNDAKKAFSYSERMHARTLLDSIKSGRATAGKISASERADEKRLQESLVALNLLISREANKPVPDAKRLGQLQQQVEANRLDLERFEMALYASHPNLRAERVQLPPVEVASLAALLPDTSTALVEFAVANDRAFIFLISKTKQGLLELNAYPLNISGQQLAVRVDEYRSKVAGGDLDFQKTARELYDILLKPGAGQLLGKTHLIIVPDGPLWELPFQTLQDETGHYLAEKAAISYAPSLTVLKEMSGVALVRRSRTDLDLLAFGNPIIGKDTSERVKHLSMNEKLNPLPEAERLVTGLSKMYGPNRSKIFIGAAAREQIAKDEAPRFRIVQFATHGILNNVSPMYSHLVLARDEKNPNEDGLLEAWEMKDLDLKADMVILSACDTARGRISGGEGVVGMTWAMFIAGTPTTVASQWKVESSSTTEFMLEFHRQMLGKQKISKAEALRRASLKLMKMPKYRHPSYWGAWVLVGDGS